MLGARAHVRITQESIRELRPFSTCHRYTVQQHGRATSLHRRRKANLKFRQTQKLGASEASEALTPALDQTLNGKCISVKVSSLAWPALQVNPGDI